MRKIFKYELAIKTEQKVEISGMRKFLKVAEQNGKLCLWCLVETNDSEIYPADVYIVGTGEGVRGNLFNDLNYSDSVIMNSGLVWHVSIV